MSPTEGQQQGSLFDGHEGFVVAGAVRVENALSVGPEEGFGFLGALGQRDGKEDGLGTAVDPQRPFVIGFLIDFHKDLPTGLVGVPMAGGLAMLFDGFMQRLQQRSDAFQSPRQGSGGQLDAVRAKSAIKRWLGR